MSNETERQYTRILWEMRLAMRRLAAPTAPLKGNGHVRHEFITGRRSCVDRYLEACPGKLLFLDLLPDAHKEFVRVGRMNISAFVSPQAQACWRQNAKGWRRLSAWRWHLRPVM